MGGSNPPRHASLFTPALDCAHTRRLEVLFHHMGHVEPLPSAGISRSVYEGGWTVEEFSALCLAALNRHGEHTFNNLIKSLIETRTEEAAQSKLRWQMAAVNIDVRPLGWTPRLRPGSSSAAG